MSEIECNHPTDRLGRTKGPECNTSSEGKKSSSPFYGFNNKLVFFTVYISLGGDHDSFHLSEGLMLVYHLDAVEATVAGKHFIVCSKPLA